MAHTSELRWAEASAKVTAGATNSISLLEGAETVYKELLEAYLYAGSTDQGLADLLFKDDWTVRSVQGVQAVITVDVAAGVVSNPVVTTAGTGYTDGTGFQLVLSLTAGGGDVGALVEYDVVAGAVTNVSVIDGGTTYTDGLGQTVQETPAAGQVFDTQANAEEVSKALDLRNAITVMHELYQAADNVVVSQDDRFAQLRRMS